MHLLQRGFGKKTMPRKVDLKNLKAASVARISRATDGIVIGQEQLQLSDNSMDVRDASCIQIIAGRGCIASASATTAGACCEARNTSTTSTGSGMSASRA
jgi:hypothetical protein